MKDNRMRNQELIQDFKEAMVGRRYRHFKGGIYIVTDIAIHSETEEAMVVYKTFNDMSGLDCVWVRPLAMFISDVDKNKYPNATQRRRFMPLDEDD